MGGAYSGSSSGPHSARPFVPELLGVSLPLLGWGIPGLGHFETRVSTRCCSLATFCVHVRSATQSAKCLPCIVLKTKNASSRHVGLLSLILQTGKLGLRKLSLLSKFLQSQDLNSGLSP